jgi:hypothetical protein
MMKSRSWGILLMAMILVIFAGSVTAQAAQGKTVRNGSYMRIPWQEGETRGLTFRFSIAVFSHRDGVNCREQLPNSLGMVICTIPGVERAEFGPYRLAIYLTAESAFNYEPVTEKVIAAIRSKANLKLSLMRTSTDVVLPPVRYPAVDVTDPPYGIPEPPGPGGRVITVLNVDQRTKMIDLGVAMGPEYVCGPDSSPFLNRICSSAGVVMAKTKGNMLTIVKDDQKLWKDVIGYRSEVYETIVSFLRPDPARGIIWYFQK